MIKMFLVYTNHFYNEKINENQSLLQQETEVRWVSIILL